VQIRAAIIALLLAACGRVGFGRSDGAPSSDALADDGSSTVDASVPVNDDCTTAIDMTAGGMVTGTTCGANDTVVATCGVAGTPDVFYAVTVTGGTRVNITITAGFLIQLRQLTCSGVGSCMVGSFSANGGGTPGGVWYFAVEKSDGGCGPFAAMFSVQ